MPPLQLMYYLDLRPPTPIPTVTTAPTTTGNSGIHPCALLRLQTSARILAFVIQFSKTIGRFFVIPFSKSIVFQKFCMISVVLR